MRVIGSQDISTSFLESVGVEVTGAAAMVMEYSFSITRPESRR
jgi:hypothetical protein